MKQIFKTLSKFTLPIVIIVALLVGQAMCDLALPDYTSKIVNIGIQQNGIENSAMEVITEEDYNKIITLSNNKKEIEKSYKLLNKKDLSESEFDKYVSEYPLLEKESIYILKDIDETQKEKLSENIGKSIVMIQTLESDNKEIKKQLSKMTGAEVSDVLGFITSLDQKSKDKFLKDGYEKINDLEPSMIDQMSIPYVKKEYEKIGIDVDKMQTNYMLSVGVKMIALALLAMVFTVCTVFLSAKVGAGFARNLRSKTVTKAMNLSNKEFEEISSASLITRCTNDITQIQMVIVMMLRMVIYAPIIGFGALSKVSGSSMSWVIGVAVLSILGLVIILFSLALPRFKKIQTLIDRINLVAREILTGLPVIRAFSTEKHEEKRFDKANTDFTKLNIFVGRVMTVMMPSMMFIMNGVSVLIIWVGASKVDMGTMQVGTLMAFITYTMQIIMAFLMLSMMTFVLPRSIISMKRIAEVLNKEISVKDKEKTLAFDPKKKGIIEFKDVYFRYPDAEEDVLRNISFTARPGETTAFIGSTGSGKSTLINLIPRFFDVTGGKILVDGVDIRNVKMHDLRDKIGYVPQKGTLFTGTIESNIAFGDSNISQKEIIKAAKTSQSWDFIEAKDKGLEEPISQGGTNVSGGQKQRLSIARALAINPEIYIFDDSFSALDYKTDAILRKELSKQTKNGTILIVAQRISTIMNADQIVVLDEGKVVGIGKHKELLESCEVYKEIALSQLSKEELENA